VPADAKSKPVYTDFLAAQVAALEGSAK